jgi:uncharacterized membrane protein
MLIQVYLLGTKKIIIASIFNCSLFKVNYSLYFCSMRLIKPFIISVIILFVLITFIGLLIPNNPNVSRAVKIARPKDSVYKFVFAFEQWANWYPTLIDSNTIAGNTIQISANKIIDGSGTSIEKLGASKDSLSLQWTTAKGKKSNGFFQMVGNDTTTVVWVLEQKASWLPWEKFGTMYNDKILGPQMEQTLENLKKFMEQK